MNTGRKLASLLILVIICQVEVYAQPPALYFRRLNQANGLSHNKVNCILQDKRGFTWIGTDDGLNRYDGNNFIVYKNVPGQASSLSGNTITDLHEDKEGIIWIATADGGISRFDYRLGADKQFRQYKHHPGDTNSIPVNIVNAMVEDEKGYLWLATSGAAVLRFDKKNEKFFRPPQDGNWTINDICFDANGTIWAGKEGGSIIRLNPSTLQWQPDPRYSNIYSSLPHVVVTRLFKDRKSDIWFGSWDKAVYKYNFHTGIEETFSKIPNQAYSFGADEAISFNEDRQGYMWIGGKYSGLYIYDPAQRQFHNYQHDPSREGSLSDNRVNCIFIDKAGIVWLGTNNGISIYNSSQQQFEQRFLPRTKTGRPLQVYDFFRHDNGTLWIGTDQGLVIKGQNGGYRLQKFVYDGVDLAITCFYKDAGGIFYFGTNYSLFTYDPVSGKLSLLPNTEDDQVMKRLIESRIVSIVRDTLEGRPILWAIPYGHFFTYYDFVEKRWVSRKDSLRNILTRYHIKDNLIRKLVKTKDGRIWFANAKNGLLLLHKNREGNINFINNPQSPGSISNNNVFDIQEDRDGNLWISTYGGGLNFFDRRAQRFVHFNSTNNLLEGLELDKYGNAWSISNGGLQRFDPKSRTFTYFELPDLEKTGGVRGYIYKDQKGNMYVAGDGYYIEFDPASIGIKKHQPEVFLTDFRIFNKSFSHLLHEKEIRLRYNENFFNLQFAAPFYESSVPVQYSYMLEGVDPDWVTASSSSPQAPYTNLGSGDYLFKVRATASPGSWSDKVTTINIRIVPPFWKRGWFFLLVLLALAGIGYMLYRYRINELLKRQAIRNKIAQDLHDNVGSTLSSISLKMR